MVNEADRPDDQATPRARQPGRLTRVGDCLPAPEPSTRPEPGVCEFCGREIEPIWLPISKRPRWHVARLCVGCSEGELLQGQVEADRRRAQEHLRERIQRAGLATPFRASRTFETFRVVEGTAEAVRITSRFTQRVGEDLREVRRGLLLCGTNGCGKTHLALAILHRVLESGAARTVLFVEFAEYLDLLKRSFHRPPEDEAAAPEWLRWAMFEVDLLAIDDIGAAAASRGGWDSEEMCRLLNRRIEAGRPLIATTDVGADELANKLGPRVVSRLYEACDMVRIEAGDYRKRGLGDEG